MKFPHIHTHTHIHTLHAHTTLESVWTLIFMLFVHELNVMRRTFTLSFYKLNPSVLVRSQMASLIVAQPSFTVVSFYRTLFLVFGKEEGKSWSVYLVYAPSQS
jgi:hypothetical protein